MPELRQNSFKRQVAYKVRIVDVIRGNFVRDNISAGYIKLNEANVSRVNIIGTVVYKQEREINYSNYSSMVVDDGTEIISLRSFEDNKFFPKIDVGDVVLVIGKVREFNDERYIIPEILKKTENIGWLNVRKRELNNNNFVINNDVEAKGNALVEGTISLNEEIYPLIKKLDSGDGVLVKNIIKNSDNKETEDIIKRLLENGSIFEVKPGRVKVLE